MKSFLLLPVALLCLMAGAGAQKSRKLNKAVPQADSLSQWQKVTDDTLAVPGSRWPDSSRNKRR